MKKNDVYSAPMLVADSDGTLHVKHDKCAPLKNTKAASLEKLGGPK